MGGLGDRELVFAKARNYAGRNVAWHQLSRAVGHNILNNLRHGSFFEVVFASLGVERPAQSIQTSEEITTLGS